MGLDIGTTAVKAVAVDADGRVVARSRVPHRLVVPSIGRLEHDPAEAWVAGPRRALAELGVRPAAVAVAALAPSLTAVDDQGIPGERGILYDDERGRPSGPYHGSDPTRSPETAELLRWLVADEPDAAGYWPAQAVANRALGGPGVVDFATAVSAGPLYDGSPWDADECKACGVRAGQLPGVRMFGEAIGRVGDAILGAGSVDAFCEQLVAGPLAEGDALVVLGSTLVVWSARPTPAEAPGLWNAPQLDGGWYVGGASNAGGLWLSWVERSLAPGSPLDAHPRRVPVWLPYIRGERVPRHQPERRAALADVDLLQGPAELRRAALEASAFVVRSLLERAGPLPRRILATGGGSTARPWLQALADATAARVEPVAVPEGAALGAAWLARMAAGLEDGIADAARWAGTGRPVDPDPAWVEATGERYGRFVEQAGGRVQ